MLFSSLVQDSLIKVPWDHKPKGERSGIVCLPPRIQTKKRKEAEERKRKPAQPKKRRKRTVTTDDTTAQAGAAEEGAGATNLPATAEAPPGPDSASEPSTEALADQPNPDDGSGGQLDTAPSKTDGASPDGSTDTADSEGTPTAQTELEAETPVAGPTEEQGVVPAEADGTNPSAEADPPTTTADDSAPPADTATTETPEQIMTGAEIGAKATPAIEEPGATPAEVPPPAEEAAPAASDGQPVQTC